MESSLWLKSGIQGVASSAISLVGSFDGRVAGLCQVCAVGRPFVDKSKVAAPPQKGGLSPSSSRFSFRYPLKYLWSGSSGGGDHGHSGISPADTVLVEDGEKFDYTNAGIVGDGENSIAVDGRNGNWIFNVLHLRQGRQEQELNCSNGELLEVTENDLLIDHHDDSGSNEDPGGEASDYVDEEEEEEEEWCDACRVDFDGEEEVEIDKETFSKFLQRVSLDQAKLYDKMAYLGNLAYAISDIKPEKLFKTHGLRMVTSSAERKKLASKAAEEEHASLPLEVKLDSELTKEKYAGKKGNGYKINPFVAYQVAASAASYLHSHIKVILPLKLSKEEQAQDQLLEDRTDGADIMNSDMASFMAATDSVTSVVAAEEEVKQALADDLNSTYSSPCNWFICDDDENNTRFFVIQGSESLASWQANLLFEPIQFEGFDFLVHRGIYEAAKGIYEQMLPEVRAHLKNHGKYATFRFTGHSLGGSLSLLINLMLLIRGEVPAASLLPVITFGAPAVMCGGDRLLHKLGLPLSHVQSITMHRDIVPRAFSCSYPSHVAEFLKAINGNFRNHPCLNNQKLLFAPMGELLILQPDEKFSPHHHLLPSGSGLYLLRCLISDDSQKHLRAAQKLFLDSPHPLEILIDHAAYGSGGTIQRDHDMNSYSRCIQVVIRQELNRIRKATREHRRKLWWPLVGGVNDGIILTNRMININSNQHQFNFSGILGNGGESVKRFSRLVASQRLHLFMVLMLPARLLMLGVYGAVCFY